MSAPAAEDGRGGGEGGHPSSLPASPRDLDGRVQTRSGSDIPGRSQNITYTPFDLPSDIDSGGTHTLFEYTADEDRVIRRDPNQTRYWVGQLYEHVVAGASATGRRTLPHLRGWSRS